MWMEVELINTLYHYPTMPGCWLSSVNIRGFAAKEHVFFTSGLESGANSKANDSSRLNLITGK